MNSSDNINELAKALVAAQKELRNPSFDSNNPHFKSRFVSLAGLRNETLPVLLKHGLCVAQSLGGDGAAVSCTTRLMHESGQWADFGPFVVPIAKQDAQTACAASTYARRYSWQAAIGVVGDEDDDGNAASGKAPAGPNADFPPKDGPIGRPAAPTPPKPAQAPPAVDPNDRLMVVLKALSDKIGRQPAATWLKQNCPAFDWKKGAPNYGLSDDGALALLEQVRALVEAKK